MFVGRVSELAAVEALISCVRRSRPAAAVIIADPGLGKTRLLAELAPRIDLPLVSAHGYEPAREIPFSASGNLLRELSGVPEVGGQLEALLFGEAARGAGIETLRVFEAAYRCLRAYGPLAVLVDDLQWADRETLALLHYLLAAAKTDDLPFLLAAASRPADEGRSLWAALSTLLPVDQFVGLELGPLVQAEGVQLVVALTPQLGFEEASELWRRSHGSPFWLEALARGGAAELSAGALLQSRFGRIDADATRVFALLVAAARPVPVADVADLLEWPQERAHSAATTLVNHALVIHAAGSVRVAHDLLREAAERQLPEDESRRLHGMIAARLERVAGNDLELLSRALEHRQAAGLPVGELALRVARLPQRRLLGRPGLEALGAIAAQLTGHESIELHLELAKLASELGEWAAALQRWGELAERLPDSADRALADLAAAEAAVRLERPADTYMFTERARALAPDDPLVAIEADVREGQALRWLQNRVTEAQDRTVRAVAAAERLLAASGGADALDDRSRRVYVAALRADLDAGIRAGDADKVALRAAEIGSTAREPSEVLTARFDAMFSLIMFEGLVAEGEKRARAALDQARRLDLPVAEVEASHWLAWALRDLGRVEEAVDITRQALPLAERVGAPPRFSLAVVRASALSAEASRGDWRRAVEQIAEQAAGEPDPHYRLNVRMARLPLLARFSAPEPAELEMELASMRADAEAAGCDRCWWQNVLFSAEARVRAGRLEAAEEGLNEWQRARPKPRPGPAARYAYARALLVAAKEPDRAAAAFATAAELAGKAGNHLLGLWIQLDAASAAADAQALREVATTATVMGALSERDLAVSRLRELGVRWRPAANDGGGELSPRERQIVAMVAAGASNPEIAQSLFLSRKTVERHVTHILAKLSLRNRVELAALARERGW